MTPRRLCTGSRACGLFLVLVGCAGPKAYVREGFLAHPPKRVAVLPFVITHDYHLTEGQSIPTSHEEAREQFRKTFFYAFTTLGYEDVRPVEVDEKLAAQWGPLEESAWRSASPQRIGEVVGAEALIYGDITHLVHFVTPLYTETSLDANLRMVEAVSGDLLWKTRVKAAERGGALLQKGQVVDFLKDQARSFKPRVKFLRVADKAARQALKGFPNPPLDVAEPVTRARPAVAQSDQRVRVAVLPFSPKHPKWRNGAEILRTSLAAHLQEGPFEILELQRVNAALQHKGWNSGEPLPSPLPLTELADELGAEAFLRGTVTNWGGAYLIVESWVKAALDVELIDAASGEVIWSGKETNTRHAGILKGPTGYLSIATAPLKGLQAGHLERVASHLTRDLVTELLTAPAVLTYLDEKAP